MVILQITSDRNDIIPVIQDAIAAKMKRTEIGFRRTEQEVHRFEKKYNIPSDRFLGSYTAEDLAGGDEDYISWMGELRLREALLEELQALHEIEYVHQELTQNKPNILLVDDRPENLLILEEVLGATDQNLVMAESGKEALKQILEKDFAAILLDVQMPGIDGFETAALIRQRRQTTNTPIIFITAESQTNETMFRGYSLGAVDFLFKPIVPDILRSKVKVFVNLFIMRQEVESNARRINTINQQLEQEIEERKLVEESLQKSEAAMRVLLSEKDVLLKEVHHRVKNNLAAIIGLLDLQGRTLNDKLVRAAFAELSNRIRSMSLVHEQLYQSKNLSQIDFQDYLNTLVAHLSSSYQRSENIHVSVAAKGVKMGLDNAIPCGLLTTELVTNAFKYAFPADMPRTGAGGCEVVISMKWDGVAYTLTVADNGVGLPADLDWRNTNTLGLVLVKMLGQHQLRGEIEVDCTGGTTFRLRFAPQIARIFE